MEPDVGDDAPSTGSNSDRTRVATLDLEVALLVVGLLLRQNRFSLQEGLFRGYVPVRSRALVKDRG